MPEYTIVAVDTQEFALELETPLSTATGTIDRREGLLVRVRAESDDGRTVTGVGEATPLQGWTEDAGACRAAIRSMAEDLRGQPDFAGLLVPRLHDGAPAACHGVSLAVSDLLARHVERQPLWRFIRRQDDPGGPDDTGDVEDRSRNNTTPTVRANATVGDADPGETVRQARVAVERGFDCLKVKVGARAMAADVDRLAAVREAVGESVTLRADANAAWDRATARRALDAVAEREIDLDYVEQPVAADDVGGLAALHERELERPRGRRTGIAADESVVAAGHEAVVDAGTVDAVVLKPMALGGPLAAVGAASDAKLAGITPIVTTTVDAVVARTAAVHVAAAVEAGVRGRDAAHGLATADRLTEDLAPDPASIESGRIDVPAGPGTGVDPEVFDS